MMRIAARQPLLNARGAVIIWFALFLLLLLCFISLGIDVAKLDAARTQLQNAADAAALAGASAIDPTTGVIDAAVARSRAQQTASMNSAFVNTPEPVNIASEDILILANAGVQVTARRDGGTSIVAHVAQVLGIAAFQMKATATARAETTGTAECGVTPLGVTPPPGGTFRPGCAQSYQLKAGGGGGTTGNYGGLNLPPCPAGAGDCPQNSGASRWGCLMANGYCCPVAIGQSLETEPGNMSGPLRGAASDRFSEDAVKAEGICYRDYLAAGGTGQRVVVVPIVTPFPNGRGTVTVTGFAAFFIKNRPGNGNNSTLDGEFVYAVIPGEGGGTGSGAVAYSVHLVPNS